MAKCQGAVYEEYMAIKKEPHDDEVDGLYTKDDYDEVFDFFFNGKYTDAVSPKASEVHYYHKNTTSEHIQQQEEEEEEDSDDDDDDMDIIDDNNKEIKKEIHFEFKGEDLNHSKIINGEMIKTTQKEIDNIKKLELEWDKKKKGLDMSKGICEGADNDKTQNNNNFDYYDRDDITGKETKDLINTHLRCRLCKHVSIRGADTDPEFTNAYEAMVDLDIEKYGYCTDAQLFEEMKDVFNTQQRFVKENGGKYFFVTLEEVSNHFRDHDISNPLRAIGEPVTYLREILRKGRNHMFGVAGKHKRKFWNSTKTKLFLQVLKQYQSLNKEFSLTRSFVKQTNGKGTGMTVKQDVKKASRHATGAPPDRRFGTQYI